jgi:hypothetical protein
LGLITLKKTIFKKIADVKLSSSFSLYRLMLAYLDRRGHNESGCSYTINAVFFDKNLYFTEKSMGTRLLGVKEKDMSIFY